MLQTLREKTTGWVAIAVLLVLAVPFAFFGVENYFQQRIPTYVAKVNDTEISQDQFRERFEDYRSRMRQMLGDRYDAREFDTPIVKRQVLESLIDEQVLREAAQKHGLVVSPTMLQQEIAGIDAFHVNGQFSPDQYRMVLAGAGMTPRIFEQRMAQDLVTRALPRSIGASSIVTDAYVDRFLALRDQTRSFDYVLLPAPDAADVGEISEADLVAYHENHADQYQSQETVSVEYVELDVSNMELDESVDELTLRERYEQNKHRYIEPEQRLASHILIQTDANADAAAQQEAQARAAELAQQARAEGADFAELARQHSDDPGSKAMGGELGWIEQGVTEPAFEEALFSMQPGISDPVKGSDGWHVIWLRDVRESSGKAFEDVRVELEKEYLESERERAFSERSGELVEAIYRDPTTLDTAAAELGLTVQKAGPFTRAGGTGIAANPDVLRAMFSDSVMREGLVSDLIELSPSHGLVLRVTEHSPAATRPLEEVRSLVEAAVREQRLEELGRAALEKAREQVTSLESLREYAQANELEVQSAENVGRNAATVDPSINAAAFKLAHPEAGSSVIGDAALAGGVHALIALTQVTDGDVSKVEAGTRDMLKQQLAQSFGTLEAGELVKALRREAEIQVVESRL